jgi:predicted transcriptional regulator of viral defense system
MGYQERDVNMNRPLATGPAESRLLTDLERQAIPVLSLKKHRALLGDFDDQTLYDLLTRLQRKGWLLRVEQGTYVVVPRAARRTWHEHPFIIAAAMAPDPYNISYWPALSYHNLTTQIPRLVAVAIPAGRRRHRSHVVFQNYYYHFIARSPATFFSIGTETIVGLNGAAYVEVAIAEPEKAILDALDDERFSGGMGEVIEALRRGLANGAINPRRLTDNALRYPNRGIVNRLGYLLAHSDTPSDILAALHEAVRRNGYPPYLSSVAPRVGAQRDATWNVLVNIETETLEEGA